MATMDPGIAERRHGLDRRSTSTSTTRGESRMSALDWIAMTLLIIGGVNWGLVGLFNFDLVASLFGEFSALSRAIYVAVGASALWCLYTASKMSR